MKNVNFGFYCGKSVRKRESTSPRKHRGLCFSMMYREIVEIDSPGINGAFCLLEVRGKGLWEMVPQHIFSNPVLII